MTKKQELAKSLLEILRKENYWESCDCCNGCGEHCPWYKETAYDWECTRDFFLEILEDVADEKR